MSNIKYTIQDFLDRKCMLINDGSLTELKIFLKAVFPEDSRTPSGNSKYYFSLYGQWGATDAVPGTGAQSIKYFLEQLPSEEKVSNRKLLGYRLCRPKYEDLVAIILGIEKNDLQLNINNCHFYPNSDSFKKIEEAGLLDIWFMPVYSEEFKTFPISTSKGVLDWRVSYKGIYFSRSSAFFDIECLDEIFKSIDDIKASLSVRTENESSRDYKSLKVTKVDIGEFKEVDVADLRAAYDYYKSLQIITIA